MDLENDLSVVVARERSPQVHLLIPLIFAFNSQRPCSGLIFVEGKEVALLNRVERFKLAMLRLLRAMVASKLEKNETCEGIIVPSS
jgi:hypothetical protein